MLVRWITSCRQRERRREQQRQQRERRREQQRQQRERQEREQQREQRLRERRREQQLLLSCRKRTETGPAERRAERSISLLIPFKDLTTKRNSFKPANLESVNQLRDKF